MAEHPIDDLFKEKLEAITPAYDETAWAGFSAQLDAATLPFWARIPQWLRWNVLVWSLFALWQGYTWHREEARWEMWQQRAIHQNEPQVLAAKDTIVIRDTVWVMVPAQASFAAPARLGQYPSTPHYKNTDEAYALTNYWTATNNRHFAWPQQTKPSGTDLNVNGENPGRSAMLTTADHLPVPLRQRLETTAYLPVSLDSLHLLDTLHQTPWQTAKLPQAWPAPVLQTPKQRTPLYWSAGPEIGVMLARQDWGDPYPWLVAGANIEARRGLWAMALGIQHAQSVYDIEQDEDAPLDPRFEQLPGFNGFNNPFELVEIYAYQWMFPATIRHYWAISPSVEGYVSAGAVGLVRYRQKIEYYSDDDGEDGLYATNIRQPGADLAFATGGLGLTYRLAKHWQLRWQAEYRHSLEPLGLEGRRVNGIQTQIGVQYQFAKRQR